MITGPRVDRRRWRRWPAADCSWLAGARLRHGFDVIVIDLSPGGALVDGTARLLPGASVELHLSAQDWAWRTGARVLRCQVSALLLERGVRYRAALQFERRLEPPESKTREQPPREACSDVAERLVRTRWFTGSDYPEGLPACMGRAGATQSGVRYV